MEHSALYENIGFHSGTAKIDVVLACFKDAK